MIAGVNNKNSISIYVGENNNKEERLEKRTDGQAKVGDRGNIFAGNLNVKQDLAAMKKQEATKQALKIVLDNYSNHLKVDQSVDEMKEQKITSLKEIQTAEEELSKLKEIRNDLRESYGVEEDSEEQKNLELLEKSKDPKQILTEEEQKQLENMPELTQYQKEALNYGEKIKEWQDTKDNALNKYDALSKGIIDTELEQLKDSTMVKSKNMSEKIMKQASKETAYILMNEVKNHIDEENEKKQEEVEKTQEEKKEEEEKLEAIKEKKEETMETSSSDEAVKNSSEQDKMKKEIKELMEKQKLIEEDLKGISVDQTC